MVEKGRGREGGERKEVDRVKKEGRSRRGKDRSGQRIKKKEHIVRLRQ